MTADSKKKGSNIDGGYAWVILASCFLTIVFCIGGIKAYGILYTEMVEYYASGTGKASWIGSLYLVSLFFIGPIGNCFARKYTFRVVSFTGGVISGIGFFLSGFVTRIENMYLTFLCIGLGSGLSTAAATTLNSFYFNRHRALANGILYSGSGVGALAMPFLYKGLIDIYGLRGALWVISGCMANICVAACVLRQPELLLDEKRKDRNNKEQTNQLNYDKQNQQQKREYCKGIDLNCSLFKHPIYTLYFMAFFFCMCGFAGNIVLIPAQVKALGYDKTHVALTVTIMGGCEIVARILTGWFSDLEIVKRKYIFSVNMFIGSVIAFIAPFFDSFTFMAIYASAVGTFPGTFWTLMPGLIIDVVGLEKFSPAFGLVWMGLGIGSCISMPFVGWLHDVYGDWTASFMLTGCMYILAGLTILFGPAITRCQRKLDTDEDNRQCQVSEGKFTRTDEDFTSCASTSSDYL